MHPTTRIRVEHCPLEATHSQLTTASFKVETVSMKPPAMSVAERGRGTTLRCKRKNGRRPVALQEGLVGSGWAEHGESRR